MLQTTALSAEGPGTLLCFPGVDLSAVDGCFPGPLSFTGDGEPLATLVPTVFYTAQPKSH